MRNKASSEGQLRRAGSAPLGTKTEDQLRQAAEKGLVDVRLRVAVRDFLDALSPGS